MKYVVRNAARVAVDEPLDDIVAGKNRLDRFEDGHDLVRVADEDARVPAAVAAGVVMAERGRASASHTSYLIKVTSGDAAEEP